MRTRLLIQCILTALLVASAVPATARLTPDIFRGDVATSISPTSLPAQRYFNSRIFKYGRGVVPYGRVRYKHEGKAVEHKEIDLALQDGKPGIRWKDTFYELEWLQLPLCPLATFASRDSMIAYTILPKGYDEEYLKENKLQRVPDHADGFAAAEFIGTEYTRFLRNVDLYNNTEPLPEHLKTAILSDVTGEDSPEFEDFGSYVKADFHVTYTVHLRHIDGKHKADVEGLPLMYYWNIAKGDRADLTDVEVYTFPKAAGTLQYRAVLFFQMTAIIRQESTDDPSALKAFVDQMCKEYDKSRAFEKSRNQQKSAVGSELSK